jgi:ubiquinone/menaquinone biosynthesis C-methylase UbiE
MTAHVQMEEPTLNIHNHFMHGKQEQQDPHTHSHDEGHGHGGLLRGIRQMGILGLIPIIAHDQAWLGNYRPSRIIPASNRILGGTIVVLLIGVVLWHMLPIELNWIALRVVILAVVHLMILVIGGLSVTLFMRLQRGRLRRTVINSIPWRGPEKVLDVGCGTGMLLNGCAQKLTSGWATGIDLWQEAIAGSKATLMANARAEHVADKIDYQEMDARHLAFEDMHFDVVVSSAALHHIGTHREDREQAVNEMIRVLAPGGYLALADVGPMIDIAESVIAQSGLRITQRTQNRFFHFVTACKA